jgi:ribosomal-protein-alanine N-acetyltransferase
LRIRPLQSRDIDSVLVIQTGCPQIAQWTAADYERAASGEMSGFLAEEDSAIAGFLVARSVGDEIEILNFAVSTGCRRRKVGTKLITHAVEWSRSLRAKRIFLEVRASNRDAIEFYKQHGFRTFGRRARYYTSPTDDALLLILNLKAKPKG